MPLERSSRSARRILTPLLAFVAIAWATDAWAETESDGEDAAVQWIVELRDGSKLIGSTETKTLPLRASFGQVDIPVGLIETIDFNDDQETVTVHCHNGDRLVGLIEMETIRLRASFGLLKIPLATVQRVSLRAQTAQLPGLILHYAFDKDDGAVVSDQSGSNHNGKVNGARHSANGVRGGAMQFNGQGSHVQIGDLGRLEQGAVVFWMNPDEVVNNRCVFSSDFRGGGYCIRLDEALGGAFTAGELARYCYTDFTRSLLASNWYHVAFVWDETTAWGYLDGELKFKEKHTRPGVPGLNRTLSDVVIGKGYSNEPLRSWKGLVDEFRIFRRLLGEKEVADLYRREGARIRSEKERREQLARKREAAEFSDSRKRPTRGIRENLALHYTFDTDDGDTVKDYSGHGRDGRAERVTFVADGVRGGACHFGDGYIEAGDIFNLGTDHSNLTVCFWIKAPPITAVSGWAAIITKSQEPFPYTGWWMRTTPASRANAGITAQYPEIFDTASSTIICDNRWHFVCSIFEIEGDAMRVLLYVDGVLADLTEWTAPHGSLRTSAPLMIGRRASEGRDQFVGTLDELRIYTRSLSAKEVAELYATRRGR